MNEELQRILSTNLDIVDQHMACNEDKLDTLEQFLSQRAKDLHRLQNCFMAEIQEIKAYEQRQSKHRNILRELVALVSNLKSALQQVRRMFCSADIFQSRFQQLVREETVEFVRSLLIRKEKEEDRRRQEIEWAHREEVARLKKAINHLQRELKKSRSSLNLEQPADNRPPLTNCLYSTSTAETIRNANAPSMSSSHSISQGLGNRSQIRSASPDTLGGTSKYGLPHSPKHNSSFKKYPQLAQEIAAATSQKKTPSQLSSFGGVSHTCSQDFNDSSSPMRSKSTFSRGVPHSSNKDISPNSRAYLKNTQNPDAYTPSKSPIREFSNTLYNQRNNSTLAAPASPINQKQSITKDPKKQWQGHYYFNQNNNVLASNNKRSSNRSQIEQCTPATPTRSSQNSIIVSVLARNLGIFGTGDKNEVQHIKNQHDNVPQLPELSLGHLKFTPPIINGFDVLNVNGRQVYKGTWKRGLFEGRGKLYTENWVYDGEFKAGTIEGLGSLHFKQYTFIGRFSKGEANGQGTLYSRDKTISGVWKRNVFAKYL